MGKRTIEHAWKIKSATPQQIRACNGQSLSEPCYAAPRSRPEAAAGRLKQLMSQESAQTIKPGQQDDAKAIFQEIRVQTPSRQ
jgi:hypothetical protein